MEIKIGNDIITLTNYDVEILNKEIGGAEYGKYKGIAGWLANVLFNKLNHLKNKIIERSGKGSKYTEPSLKEKIIQEEVQKGNLDIYFPPQKPIEEVINGNKKLNR